MVWLKEQIVQVVFQKMRLISIYIESGVKDLSSQSVQQNFFNFRFAITIK